MQEFAGHITGTAASLDAKDKELSREIQASKIPPIRSGLNP
ncbi:hypothetical protein [Streptococcus oricebi]|nr:hypothetical protein [Streptococcus oricebi]